MMLIAYGSSLRGWTKLTVTSRLKMQAVISGQPQLLRAMGQHSVLWAMEWVFPDADASQVTT